MSIKILGYIEIRLILFGLFCADRKSGNPYGMTYDARRSSKHNGNVTLERTIEAHDSLVNAVTFSPGRARTSDRLITNILETYLSHSADGRFRQNTQLSFSLRKFYRDCSSNTPHPIEK